MGACEVDGRFLVSPTNERGGPRRVRRAESTVAKNVPRRHRRTARGDALVRLELHARAHVPRLHGSVRAARAKYDLIEEIRHGRHPGCRVPDVRLEKVWPRSSERRARHEFLSPRTSFFARSSVSRGRFPIDKNLREGVQVSSLFERRTSTSFATNCAVDAAKKIELSRIRGKEGRRSRAKGGRGVRFRVGSRAAPFRRARTNATARGRSQSAALLTHAGVRTRTPVREAKGTSRAPTCPVSGAHAHLKMRGTAPSRARGNAES